MYKKAVQYLKDTISLKPEIGIILGSGLGEMADFIKSPTIIPYKDIPDFPATTVEGHSGRFIIGSYGGKSIIAMQGRFHFYEGYDMETLTLPVRVMNALGIKVLIVTNAAGGINDSFAPGDLMAIDDHINFSGFNPLRGFNDPKIGPRFPDMSYAYDHELRKILIEEAEALGIQLKKGVYAMMLGPSYETPAEVKMLRVLGADAVGMSTVPEVIIAVHGSVRVVGISCITNMAAGILPKPLNHKEVMEIAEKAKDNFIQLLNNFIAAL